MKSPIFMEKSYAPFSIHYFTVFNFTPKLPYNMKLLAFCSNQQLGLFYRVLLSSSCQISPTFLVESCSKSRHRQCESWCKWGTFQTWTLGTAGVHFPQCWPQVLMWFSSIATSFCGFRWTQSLPHDLLAPEFFVTQSRRCSHCAKRRHHHVAKHTRSNGGSKEGKCDTEESNSNMSLSYIKETVCNFLFTKSPSWFIEIISTSY